MFIVDGRSFLTGDTICGFIFQSENCVFNDGGNYNWTININQDGFVPSNGSKSEISTGGADNLNIIQITDTHFDPKYQEGSNAVCNEPACCREDQVGNFYFQIFEI